MTAWCKHYKVLVFSWRFHWLQKRKLCAKHRECNWPSLLLLERQITLQLLWWNKLVFMLGLKIEVKTGVNLEGKLWIKFGVKPGQKFRIGLPKMHRRIGIGLPKVHGRFRMGPPQVFNPICPYLMSTVGEFRCSIANMLEKHRNVLFEKEWRSLHFNSVLANKGLLIIPPFTRGHMRSHDQSQSLAQWFPTNKVSESFLMLSHSPPIEFIFAGGWDEYVLFVCV